MEPRYTPRDISWLQFNHRVLQEAADSRVPLYERIKFLAIYSSNLDEFFRVRVASLRSFKELQKSTRRELNVRPKKELRVIRQVVTEQQQQFGRIWKKEILPALADGGIYLIGNEDFSAGQRSFVKQYFQENILEQLQIIWLSDPKNAPFLQNRGLYLVITFIDNGTDLALVEIPSDKLDRFVTFPHNKNGHYITFLDDIIRSEMDSLFPHKNVDKAYAVKISRDAELYIEDEYSGNLVEKIRQGLEERNVGLPTRFLYDSEMPGDILKSLQQQFNLSKYDLVPGARYHNFNDFFAFPDPLKKPNWHYEPLPPLPHPVLEKAESLIEAMARRDYILHFPYQKYDYIPRFIREAAADELVDAVKITLYRVASKSAVTEALLYALDQGKKVVVFIEAKARFDEASNLYWGEQLTAAGAKVIYSYPGIKVHSKLLMVRRRESDGTKYYAYIGTGNFNEKTAKLYCDHALLTSNPKLTKEAAQVFDLLERKIIVPNTKNIFISPFTTRQRFVQLVDKEIAQAKKGGDAFMILKMNSLEDAGMIDKLYEASQAGVRIRMIVRGICCLIPGIPGLSENIEITSIVDRFLEHARIYIFGNGGQEKMYIASADWMTRNLDQRVEVTVPIFDPEIFAELRNILDIQQSDNTKARIIDAEQKNAYVPAGHPEVQAQLDIYQWLKSLHPHNASIPS